MNSLHFSIPDATVAFKISRIKGRKSLVYVQSLEQIFVLVAGRQVYALSSDSPTPPSNRSGSPSSQKPLNSTEPGSSVKNVASVPGTRQFNLVLELEKTRPFAKSISAFNGMILLQLDDDHLDAYKMSKNKLVIQERLPVLCHRSDKLASAGTHLTLVGREGARVFSKAIVEHVLCSVEDEPSASLIAHGGSIYVASSAKQEILQYLHPFYHEKTLALHKGTIVDALVGLQNSIASLETKKSGDLFQQALDSATNGKETAKGKSTESADVLGALMNIGGIGKTVQIDDGPLKRLCIYSTINYSGNAKMEMHDLDEFVNIDRLESDGKENIYLYSSSSTTKPLYHFNILTRAFTLLPIPEDFLVLDLSPVPQSSNLYVLVGKKRQTQSLLGVDAFGFTDFEEIRLIEASVRLTSKRFAEDERDNVATVADVMKAIRKLDTKMDRIETLLLNLKLSDLGNQTKVV